MNDDRDPGEFEVPADYTVVGKPGDTVFLLCPENEQAKQNLLENVMEDAQWLGHGVAVEHRYLGELVEQLREEGWVVR